MERLNIDRLMDELGFTEEQDDVRGAVTAIVKKVPELELGPAPGLEPWAPSVISYVIGRTSVRLRDVLSEALDNDSPSRADEMRVAAILRRAGWSAKQVGAKRIRTWFPADDR